MTVKSMRRKAGTLAMATSRMAEQYNAGKMVGLRVGITLVDEEFWREQRRFMMRHLRDFGWGKTNMMETIIQREDVGDALVKTSRR
ncbi:hypothetical protein B566_EDAN009731 [Ephemera danica]|nr:hypothetical protein B566_EDAN009731 [Ephemera danica]